MNPCKQCGSYAINHHCHGRDGSDGDLCDVCYWRKRAYRKGDLLGALEGFMEIVEDSEGVAGYHCNGDIANWDEFDVVFEAEAIIDMAKGEA